MLMMSIFFVVCFGFYPEGKIVSKVEWLTPTTHDFGDIRQGEAVKTVFRFKNISDKPVSVDNVRSTCGCTSPDWENEIVDPLSEGTITVEYDAKKSGWFKKKITVFFSGQKQPERLQVEGFVEE
jgi:hypothetical protein